MTLLKLEDFYPDHHTESGDADLKKFSVYAQGEDKVGSVNDILVDAQDGRFRYFVVDTGFWVFGKKVLLPVGSTRVDYTDKRVYVSTMTREQVEHLPNYDDLEKVDYEYEEQVRNVYRPARMNAASVDTATPVDASTAVAAVPNTATTPTHDRNSYSYDYDQDLYNLNDQDHNSLKLYEERLVANKVRQKAGEVTIGKHIETETAHVAVPVERERVVIERTTPTAGTTVASADAFREGEVARVEVYEETPDIHKEAFVREEVQVRKEVDREVATAEETIRREELEVNADGNPVVKQ
jgi:uncharacterized protein (TIGR02271 family)